MGMMPGDVLAGISGWAGASISVLDGGLSNHTWLVEKDGRSAVLKIDEKPRGEPYNTRPGEAAIQARAFDAGLANRVLYVDETVYMTEYVEGTVWSPDYLCDRVQLEQLAAALGTPEYSVFGMDKALAASVAELRFGRELWQIFLWIAAVLLALEMILARSRAPEVES